MHAREFSTLFESAQDCRGYARVKRRGAAAARLFSKCVWPSWAFFKSDAHPTRARTQNLVHATTRTIPKHQVSVSRYSAAHHPLSLALSHLAHSPSAMLPGMLLRGGLAATLATRAAAAQVGRGILAARRPLPGPQGSFFGHALLPQRPPSLCPLSLPGHARAVGRLFHRHPVQRVQERRAAAPPDGAGAKRAPDSNIARTSALARAPNITRALPKPRPLI